MVLLTECSNHKVITDCDYFSNVFNCDFDIKIIIVIAITKKPVIACNQLRLLIMITSCLQLLVFECFC